MSQDLLLKSIATHISLEREEEEHLVSLLRKKKIRRKQFLYQEGDTHKHAVFVIEGCLRSYSIDKNGAEHVLQFAPPGWWIGDMQSLIKQQPGNLFVDAIYDSEVLMILKSDLNVLFTQVPKMERFFRILAENALAASQCRLIDNLSLSAIDRYDRFCKLYPSLITDLPQKQVAAYIGVTPEFLSKMLHQGTIAK